MLGLLAFVVQGSPCHYAICHSCYDCTVDTGKDSKVLTYVLNTIDLIPAATY